MSGRLASTGPGSCRQCAVSCDRVVHPAGCLRIECPKLYAHRAGGRTWIGCLAGVFSAQIDIERFRRMQGTAAGFGGLRLARDPLPVCPVEVQRTFAHRGGACVNPDFLLCDAPGGYEVLAGTGDAAA
jgi:hypothetical protein